MDLFRRFFGLHDRHDQFDQSRYNDETYRNDFRRNDEDVHPFPRRGFHIFSDPMHMQQYFEQEMDAMLRSFGFQGFGNFFSESHNFPSVEQGTQYEDQPKHSSDLRDQFLKHGYEKPLQQYSEKVDRDLDDKVVLGDIDSIIGGSNKQISPYEGRGSGKFFFGSTQTMKTITHSDGSIETHQSLKDNEGNEEKTTCRIFGDKQYCVIKKRDSSGKEEVTERLVNMDENEKDKLLNLRQDVTHNPSNFPYDKFFK